MTDWMTKGQTFVTNLDLRPEPARVVPTADVKRGSGS